MDSQCRQQGQYTQCSSSHSDAKEQTKVDNRGEAAEQQSDES